eukprot:3043092-Pleurochrysis_carterae.AAC.1
MECAADPSVSICISATLVGDSLAGALCMTREGAARSALAVTVHVRRAVACRVRSEALLSFSSNMTYYFTDVGCAKRRTQFGLVKLS